ncbi:MAG: YraN family protein [Micropepsaceae bacterium]
MDKAAALARGRSAERRAAILLRLKGYAVLARNFRPAKNAGLGEIDIVARRGRTLAFVEVKARAAEADAIFAIAPEQQARIARAAAHFLKVRPVYQNFTQRYDAMVLEAGRFWPRHLTDAFRP